MTKHQPMKDRRDIGDVVFLSETMAAARESSSCCVGVEAALASKADSINMIVRRALSLRDASR